MSDIDLSQISDMALIDEINGRDNGLCVWTVMAREEAMFVINALAGRDPAKLEGLLEAVKALVDRIETGSNFCDELTNTIDALAAFEGGRDE